MAEPKSPEGWRRLTCDCGSERFVQVLSLRWREGGGVTMEPIGYACQECHGVVDSARLIRLEQLKSKQRAAREMQREVDEEAAAAKKG